MKDNKKKSGQAVVEYILIITVMVSIIAGVFWAAISRHIDTLQQNMEAQLRTVIAQTEIGIPVGWFGAGEMDLSGVDFNGGSPGADNSEGANDNPLNEPTSSGDGDNGNRNNDSSPGASPSGASPNSGAASSPNNSVSSSSANSSSNTQSADENSPQGDRGGRARNQSANDSSQEIDGEVSDGDRPPVEGSTAEQEQNQGAQAPGEGLTDKQRFLFGRNSSSSQGGCRDMDMFLLIKIGAFIAIVLLFLAVLVTAKGQKGD